MNVPWKDGGAAAVPAPAPPHSTTNDYVPGADEPDLVKSDGSRVLTVERGVLRIVDTATKTVTARLTLADPQRAWGASNLLVEGNRALVILAGGGGVGAPDRVAASRPYPAGVHCSERRIPADFKGWCAARESNPQPAD